MSTGSLAAIKKTQEEQNCWSFNRPHKSVTSWTKTFSCISFYSLQLSNTDPSIITVTSSKQDPPVNPAVLSSPGFIYLVLSALGMNTLNLTNRLFMFQAKPGFLGGQCKIYQVLVNLSSLKGWFLFCHLNYLAFIPDVYILFFLLKSSFSACCLFPTEALGHCNKATLQPFFSNRLNCAIHSTWSIFLSFHAISQIHRLAEVRRHLWGPSAQNRVTQRRLLRTVSQQVWNKYQIII